MFGLMSNSPHSRADYWLPADWIVGKVGFGLGWVANLQGKKCLSSNNVTVVFPASG